MVPARETRALWMISIVLGVCLVTFPAHARYSGGGGTADDPYQIATAEGLIALGETPADYDKHFILTADIDLDPNLPGRRVFDRAVIAPDVDTAEYYFQGAPFTGVFDGNGYTILNLTVKGVSYLGLFGELASGAELKDLGVIDVNISGSGDVVGGLLGHNQRGGIVIRCYSTGTVNGDDNVGGLVGRNSGRIAQCYSTSAVSGNYIVAGLLGANEGEGAVAHCYSTGAVNGDDAVAGLVGFNLGDVTRCCSAGKVTGSQRVGGFVGWTYGSIAASFWDVQTSGQTKMCGSQEESATGCDDSVGLTTAQMQTGTTFLAAGWDFVDETANSSDDIWKIAEGLDYPRLWWEKYGGGSGEPNSPYLIYAAEHMNAIGAEPNDWDKNFRLTADIDLGGYTGASFNIIGYHEDWRYDRPFSGVFDGNGRTISNFSYTSAGRGYVGLFGHVAGVNAAIRDLRLVNPDVTAGMERYAGSIVGLLSSGAITECSVEGGSVSGTVRDTGGLAGSSMGIIDNCHVQNTGVSGDSDTGGLVGSNGGRVSNCHSQADVSGKSYIGGLAGYNAAVIHNSSSEGSVSADEAVGGLTGYNDGVITSCFAAAGVRGGVRVGGLVGSTTGTIADCYATGRVSGDNGVGGLAGVNDSFAVILNCYSVGRVSGTLNPGGLVGFDYGGVVLNSVWDIMASGQLVSDGGMGMITQEMRLPATFMNLGWDLVGQADGPHDLWAQPPGGGYMVLAWQLNPLAALPAFSGGSGRADDPYLISNAGELNSIGHNPRLMEAHFRLTEDIDLNGMDFFAIGDLWYPYMGGFDGNGKRILNFVNTSRNENFVGFFRCVHGINTWIKDLALTNPNVDTGTESYVVGALVGWLENAVITDCHAQDAIVAGGASVGGLVGSSYYGLIGNSYTTGNVSGSQDVGGLMGFGEANTQIYNSHSTCTVTGSSDVGGLAGWISGRIDNCRYVGSVSGESIVGGLVGYKHDTVMNCYARAVVSGESYVGGLLGHSCCGVTLNCYSAGTVTGSDHVGGLAGNNDDGEIRSSFWDIESSGRLISAGGTGKTTAEMQMQSTFTDAGWDFVDETANGADDIWWILEEQGYPKLWWETNSN